MLPLSLVWLFFLGGLGFSLPFFTLYLTEWGGLSGAETGAVVATIPAAGVLVQGFWGRLSDRTGARREILALVCVGAACGQAALLFQRSFAGFLWTTAAMACFSAAVVPLAMASSLAVLDERGAHVSLGRVRVWGTLGFAFCVLGFPIALGRGGLAGWLPPGAMDAPRAGGEAGLPWIFVGSAIFMAVAAIAAWCLPRTRALSVRAERGDWRELLALREYRIVLGLQFASFLAIQGPMHLFPILVRARGGGVSAISEMWAWMLALEIPLVLAFGWTVSRIGLRGVLLIGMTSAAIRWTASGWIDDLGIVTFFQLLHGVTVWGLMMGFPVTIDALVPEHLRSTAQGISAVVGASLGAIASSLAAGWLVDHLGPAGPARFGGALAACVAIATWWILPDPAHRRLGEASLSEEGGRGAEAQLP